ncbi:MAG: efflux RND transporter periplasmic adaptor subunit [Alphaproteobacteria bacterium]|nr:efflux RND transporter periplasmic adaptor subunit [Alphaproteobacteria bacterium]
MSLTSAPRSRRFRIPGPVIAGVVLLALIIAGVAAWQMRPKAPKDPYRTAAVEQGDLTKTVSASGTLQALVTVEVGSQISGQIKQVLVDFNDVVVKGQVMAILDPQTYVSRVRQSQANVNSSGAGLKQAQANAAKAKADYDRAKFLFDKGITAQAALDTAKAAHLVALANVEAARAAISQSQAAMSINQLDLGRTTIVAPIAGVVVDRQIEPGQTVAASLSAPILFKIAQDLSKLEVKITVDEADIGQVREGQAVKFTVDAFPDDTFEGLVTQVRKQPETSSNVVAYIVLAEAENPGGKLLPGMTANADIVVERRRNVVKVPAAALRWKPVDASAATPRTSGASGAANGAQGQSGQGDRQGGGAGNRVLAELDLDAGQKAKAEAIFAEVRQKAMAAGASGGDRRKVMREAMEGAFVKLEPILKPEQKTKLVAVRARLAAQQGQRRGGMTAGMVYVLRKDKPEAVPVRVGATDGSFTEIVGALKAGDEVITGGGPKAKLTTPGGGMPGSSPVRVRM